MMSRNLHKDAHSVTGDLSFFYDSNALWNDYIPDDFRIILINNSGGGIFRILPGKEETENFSRFFETKHNLSATHLCEMYGFDYIKATDEKETELGLKLLYENSGKPKLLEVFTPRTINDSTLIEYFKSFV